MRALFLDAGFFIAVLNPKDKLHAAAIAASKQHVGFRQLTSEMVLVEVLAHFSNAGPHARAAAALLVETLRKSPNTEIVPQSSDLFRRALARYAERRDKEWSLVDCASMLIMEERNLKEALTPDHHFEQAGFTILIKAPAP
jgi:hypothetical protein